MKGSDDHGAKPALVRTARKCPICGREAVREFVPFCSKRCADVDLHRWLNGVYAIPGEQDESGEEPAGDD
ncbi:MAG: DNA gyrase inhibitor YacG [Rhizobiales bacterium]|jgi:endogenous inhibitor of DNA gyrase (YacG/DUF329 family)|nr:DNA gyrase inhibitor YacG [Hyphomicrobiales bacterium]MDQ3560059.1 DNA gyrase inhibitor YacG [Pseudomonadota bacterium]